MAVAPNAVLEFRIGYTVNGQRLMNVTHWKPRSTIPGFTPYEAEADFAESMRLAGAGGLVDSIRGCQSVQVTIDSLAAQFVYPTRYRSYTWEGALLGLLAGDCEAQNLQASIEKIGAVADRHNIGGFRLGGLPTNFYNQGLINPVLLPALTAVADALKGPFATNGPPPEIYDAAILNKTPIVVDGKKKFIISGYTPVVDTDVKEEVRCMTRRTVGRGI